MKCVSCPSCRKIASKFMKKEHKWIGYFDAPFSILSSQQSLFERKCTQTVFYVFLRILCLCSHLCFLYQGQSKSLLSCCVILITLFSEQIRQESPDCRNYSVFVITFTIIACSCAFLYVLANLRLLIS